MYWREFPEPLFQTGNEVVVDDSFFQICGYRLSLSNAPFWPCDNDTFFITFPPLHPIIFDTVCKRILRKIQTCTKRALVEKTSVHTLLLSQPSNNHREMNAKLRRTRLYLRLFRAFEEVMLESHLSQLYRIQFAEKITH